MEPRKRTIALFLVAVLVAAAAWLALRHGDREEPPAAVAASPAAAAPPAAPRPTVPRLQTATSDAPAPQPSAGAEPDPRDAVIATLTGHVVDAATSAPIADAELQWGYAVPGTEELQHDLFGQTKDDGSLAFVYPRTGWWAPDRPDDAAELWVWAQGYAMVKIRAPVSPVEVRLLPEEDGEPREIRVRAFHGDGAPWKGLVLVEASDEFGHAEQLCAVAQDDGRFTLLAVPAHLRRLRIDEQMPWTELPALKTKSGAAEVELRGPKEPSETIASLPLVIENLPEDAVPLVEVRVETHGAPLVWRLPVEKRAVTLATYRDVPYRWRVTVTRAGGVAESRGVMILGTRGGKVDPASGESDGVKRRLVQREDGTLVADWEQLVPAR